MTINEIFLSQIIKTYTLFLECGDIKKCCVAKQRDELLSKKINEGTASIATIVEAVKKMEDHHHDHHGDAV